MIKNYNPRPFDGANSLPTYVIVTHKYELTARIKNGYTIMLAKLTVGQSVSSGNLLAHALFESFSDHGERMVITRVRVNGCKQIFLSAAMNAMIEAGVDFEFDTPCHFEMILTSLGAWLQLRNPEIEKYNVVSLICH